MVLIGLIAGKGSGKTTAAIYLTNELNFIEKSFADPLKKACQELFLFTNEQVNGTQEQKETPDPEWYNCTPRKVLQYVGTDLLREQMGKLIPELGIDIFTHGFKIWYNQLLKENPNASVIVSDIRFQDEADTIKNLGGYIIKIDRPGLENLDNHPSETQLKKITNYHKLIVNDGTLDYFYKNIMECVNEAKTMNFSESQSKSQRE